MRIFLGTIAALLLAGALVGCRKDTDSSCDASSWGALLPPQTVATGITRAMGLSVRSAPCSPFSSRSEAPALRGELVVADAPDGGVSLSGRVDQVLVPVQPLFDSNFNLLAPPRLTRIDSNGTASDFYEFPDAASAFNTGLFEILPFPGGVDNGYNLVPRTLFILTATRGDAVYVANSQSGEVFKLEGGTRTSVATGIPGIAGLALDADGTVTVASSPVFAADSPETLLTPPRIVQIASDGTQSTRFTYPSDAQRYQTRFDLCKGPSTGCIAAGFYVGLAFEADGSLLAAANFDSAIRRIDAQGTATALASNVVGATGLAVGADGDVYYAESPQVASDSSGITVTSGVRVSSLSANGAVTRLYEGEKLEIYNTGFISGPLPLDLVFGLQLDSDGDLFLEDSRAGNLVVLPRAPR